MSRKGLWWAAALVVVANLGAFALAALNQSSEPEAILELTERELPLPERQADNTALSLTIAFDRPRERGPRRLPAQAGWFDMAKLQSIGFDCRAPVTAENASHYGNMVRRSTFAVLEYEGESWRAVAEPPESPENRLLQSHLVAIDVGSDPARLREQYPDRRRTAIVEATAELLFVSSPGREPFLAGRVVAVLPAGINVPREWRALLEGLQTDSPSGRSAPALHDPRYRVTVKWGRNLEPWIADVQTMDTRRD